MAIVDIFDSGDAGDEWLETELAFLAGWTAGKANALKRLAEVIMKDRKGE